MKVMILYVLHIIFGIGKIIGTTKVALVADAIFSFVNGRR